MGFPSRVRQHRNASLPPRRTAFLRLANAAAGSSKNITPKLLSTRSKTPARTGALGPRTPQPRNSTETEHRAPSTATKVDNLRDFQRHDQQCITAHLVGLRRRWVTYRARARRQTSAVGLFVAGGSGGDLREEAI
jgi:hypothetical protein